jgi:peptide chain release factor 2
LKNRDVAMKMLKAKLFLHYQALHDAEDVEGGGRQEEDRVGGQIRSYVFQPYQW